LGDLKYEIILVDNNSGDDLSDLVSLIGAKTDIKLITSPKNCGMGGGNNLGIKAASGQYILILNPDTVIRDRAILVLLDYLKNNKEAALVGPKLLNPDGSLQYSCSQFPKFYTPILRRTFLGRFFKNSNKVFAMKGFDHNSIKEVDWLMGSCLMFRKEITLADGQIFKPLFDERYFMYFEDIDLCRQIWANDFKVVYIPEAILIHDHMRQSAKHPWYLAIFLDKLTWCHIESWLKYFLKWTIK
jgi:GT2 family glycosyltransferase